MSVFEKWYFRVVSHFSNPVSDNFREAFAIFNSATRGSFAKNSGIPKDSVTSFLLRIFSRRISPASCPTSRIKHLPISKKSTFLKTSVFWNPLQKVWNSQGFRSKKRLDFPIDFDDFSKKHCFEKCTFWESRPPYCETPTLFSQLGKFLRPTHGPPPSLVHLRAVHKRSKTRCKTQ